MVVSNLATALAQSGKRVTIVDADMRRPRIHKEFTLRNVSGLSTLFVSPSLELDNALQPTNITGLSVVTAGSLPPNPAELLASDKMSDILRVIGESADMIIIDTPPATVVTDAIALASRVDGVIVVIHLAFTRLGALRHTVDELRRVGTNILGVVVNGVDAGDIRYNYGKYDHYYSDDRVNAPQTRNPVLRVWDRIRHKQSNQSSVQQSSQDQQRA
jgi:capsular exopolysaccharide synthesis family protein